jgi:4-diphosphocytidyl-2C-methyl-D-erythritol kinase
VQALRDARAAGAEAQLLSGSGPTVVGLFSGSREQPRGGPELAERAARRLGERVPAALSATPVDAELARAVTLADSAAAGG